MIAILQRVTTGSVSINNSQTASIGNGYVILLGVFQNDTHADADKVVSKILTIRIMADEQDKMNRSIVDVGGEILLVSQFTLCADLTQGRRPSFTQAKKPQEARALYEYVRDELVKNGVSVQTGEFGAMMQVQLVNDGPVTMVIESKKLG